MATLKPSAEPEHDAEDHFTPRDLLELFEALDYAAQRESDEGDK